jgi:hypothetical protein
MQVRIELTERMLGTAPKDRDVYTKFVAAKQLEHAKKHPNDEQEVLPTVEEIESAQSDIENAGWTGFRSDENGLFIPAYMIRGFLKEAAQTVKDHLGIRALSARITTNVFVTPRVVHLGKTMPDGVIERPLRAQTMQGPRVSLARSDYVDAGTQLEFTLRCIPHKDVKDWRRVLTTLLAYGSFKGLGQWRSGGMGTFNVVSIDGEPVDIMEYLEPLFIPEA